MKTQKLSLHNFETVGTEELLSTKGGLRTPYVDYVIDSAQRGGETTGSGSGSGGGSSPCGTRLNGFYLESPLPKHVPFATSNGLSTSFSVTNSVLGQIVKKIVGIPGSLLSTQGLNMHERDPNPIGGSFWKCPDGSYVAG